MHLYDLIFPIGYLRHVRTDQLLESTQKWQIENEKQVDWIIEKILTHATESARDRRKTKKYTYYVNSIKYGKLHKILIIIIIMAERRTNLVKSFLLISSRFVLEVAVIAYESVRIK